MTKLEIRPLDAPLGAEILGPSTLTDLDANDVALLKAALAQHHLLLFRGDVRSPQQLATFAGRMGDVAALAHAPGSAVVTVGTHDPTHPSPTQRNVDIEWHTDASARAGLMGKESFLQGRIVPSRGGQTCFVSMYEVYDALPPTVRMRLDGVRTISDPSAYFAEPDAFDRRVVRPLVVTHPESGRRTLYIQPYQTIAILDLPKDEAHELFVELIDRILQPERIYEHVWHQGDLVVFDTVGTLHRRNAWDPAEKRELDFIHTSYSVLEFPVPTDAPRADLSDNSLFRKLAWDAGRDHHAEAVAWARRQAR